MDDLQVLAPVGPVKVRDVLIASRDWLPPSWVIPSSVRKPYIRMTKEHERLVAQWEEADHRAQVARSRASYAQTTYQKQLAAALTAGTERPEPPDQEALNIEAREARAERDAAMEALVAWARGFHEWLREDADKVAKEARLEFWKAEAATARAREALIEAKAQERAAGQVEQWIERTARDNGLFAGYEFVAAVRGAEEGAEAAIDAPKLSPGVTGNAPVETIEGDEDRPASEPPSDLSEYDRVVHQGGPT
jgi:hypothetical protein